MVFRKLLKKKETLVGIDLGSSAIKILELEIVDGVISLVSVGAVVTPLDAIQGNTIVNQDGVATALATLIEEQGLTGKRAAVAMPSPSVFTKRIKMPHMNMSELADNVHLEAGSFIPHSMDGIKLDFHVLGESGQQLDVLVVAVKDEIVDSYLETLLMAGVETAVVDADYFSLQNCLEIILPQSRDKTVAAINIGSRFSSINICRAGQSVFTGDASVGGRLFTDAIMEEMEVDFEDAEGLKLGNHSSEDLKKVASEIILKNIDYATTELNRQLSLFWSASGVEQAIDEILLSGGGALLKGIVSGIAEKTGIKTTVFNPFESVIIPEGFDSSHVKRLAPFMAVAVGLALREPGDKITPEFIE